MSEDRETEITQPAEPVALGGPSLAGKYTFVRNEKFDDFLAANGANWMIRKMATATSPELEITQDGDKFYMKLHSLVHTKETRFTVGEDFDETQQNGAVMKVSTKWNGDKLVMSYEPKTDGQGKPQTCTRELQGDELIVTLELDSIVAKRIFKKVA